MERYTKFVLEHNQTMPDPTEDIVRISDLHSWYKHLEDFTKAYPLLIQGEEPAYSFRPEFTDENQKNFHWVIVMDYNIDEYCINISGDNIGNEHEHNDIDIDNSKDNSEDNNMYEYIPDDVKQFMMKYPIYLDADFSSQNNDKSRFLRHICKKMCEEFWCGLTNLPITNEID